MTEIGEREHDAGGDDADANLERAIDGEDEDDAVRASDRSENVDRDNRRRVAGERCGVSREIAQAASRRSAEAAHQNASPTRKPTRSWRQKAARTTMAIAPITVPIIRNIDLRSDAPEHRLADQRRRRRRPGGLAELKREGDIEGNADGGPQPQAEQKRGRRGAQPFRQRSAGGTC